MTQTPALIAATIRSFISSDYETYTRLGNTLWPDYAGTVDEMQSQDARRDPKLKHRRFIAEADGNAVGYASYGQHNDMYHPQKFWVDIGVLPDFQDQGIGGALYEHLCAALLEFDPIKIQAHAQESKTSGVRFLTRRGFAEEMRDWESRLNLSAFDPAVLQSAADKVATQGIVIKTLPELAADPHRDEKLYELDCAITADMPSPDPFTKPEFAQWKRNIFESPNFLPDAWFLALDTNNYNRYVGESTLWKSQALPHLETGATGVLRAYRGRGIASALKQRAALFGKGSGAPFLRTWNAQQNAPMLAINVKMGFEKQPAWILFAKQIKEENQ